MENLEIYCVTHLRLPFLETLGYKIAAAGNAKLPENYISCSDGDNIIAKEKHYSEYVFHYWFWKNKLKFEHERWIGFCQRRRFWTKTKISESFVFVNIIFHMNLHSHPLSLIILFYSLLPFLPERLWGPSSP